VAYDAPLDADEARARTAREVFERRRGDAPPELRGIFTNPWMDIHFDFIFGPYLAHMARHVRNWKRFFALHRPKLVAAQYAAPAIDVASHLGIPCLMLPHGLMMLGETDFYQSLPEVHIGALSEPHRDRLLRLGIPAERVHVTGDPAIDTLLECAGNPLPSRPSHGAGGAAADFGRDDKTTDCRNILLVTANICSPVTTTRLPEVDFREAVRAFAALGDLAHRRPEWRFIIKRHPRYDFDRLYERMNRGLPEECRFRIVDDEPLDTLVRAADAVVFPNTRTSAVFEASLHAKPVYILSGSMIWSDHAAWGTDRWPHVASVEELEEELDAIFTNPRRCRGRVLQTRHALHRSFGGPPESAVGKCLELIRSDRLEDHKAACAR
jgi:hypothetical protein